MPEENGNPAEDRKSRRPGLMLQAGRYSHLAFALPAATVIGWLAGTLLDRWLHTSWIYIAGLLVGIVAGFVELIRSVLAAESKEPE